MTNIAGRRWGGIVVVLAALAGCAQTPAGNAPAGGAQQSARIPPQNFPPGMTGETPPPANEAQLTNDPSAPLDTPLCGAVQHETNRIGAQVFDDAVASGSACSRNACFNPLTGTYITATGAPGVCR
ncbi:hypothetical protein [Swaminathania salitolerans]|uniref:Uncharacterized protein n=1 Tax=Swaminathania salitolerans TaxID=182838 RepID=A0A511BS85_9PROT|nr:hypothetical protein [Swaminathania salitolerans]GBQ12880.1 hypothetical protein AA21291_1329 [Swaminathania salitolerans LMG 21291]GEL03197.1 hypothetical protein SSA02_23600 [Swaminathania salitolerans]